jgi:hypothetical protein
MVLNLRPKCANPSCAASFEWLAGGRLFRFERESGKAEPIKGADECSAHGHPIAHFWLCERCSNIYTLRHEHGRGIVISPLWPQLPAAENHMHLRSS